VYEIPASQCGCSAAPGANDVLAMATMSDDSILPITQALLINGANAFGLIYRRLHLSFLGTGIGRDNVMTAAIPRAHCRKCGHPTNQTASAPFESLGTVNDDGSGYEIHFAETSVMLQCQVCKTTQLRVHSWNSENGDCGEVYYPPHPVHAAPKWIDDLPGDYRELVRQIYPALDAGSLGVAMMGTRAVLDVFITNQSTETHDFGRKLTDLASRGLIMHQEVPVLRTVFEAGSGASHRGFLPWQAEVLTVLQIIEDLVHRDLLRAQAIALKARIPPDARKKK
jgi:hypothetical protein